MAEVKVDCAQIRAVLDAAIEVALPAAGGVVRKRLKQLRKALAENDAKRHEGYCPNCVMRCEEDHPACKQPGGGCRMDRLDQFAAQAATATETNPAEAEEAR